MMADTKKRKGTISEEDVSLLLQRYSATTILALLQEVAQFASTKIDWTTLTKKTTTGISSPREYQMLWRHLAYHHSLVENLEDDSELLDDDSDLDYELDASPVVSSEASTEAAACVKVLMSSGSPSDSGAANRPTVEAPLTINIPNGQASQASLDNQQMGNSNRGLNITVPVSVQRQPLPATPTEGWDKTGPANSKQPAKKKRRPWTAEEDKELTDAVEMFGEGNWQNILKEGFKHDRTASQLSQRWSILKSKLGKTNAGSALTEAQLSARQAISMALDMPKRGSISAICSVGIQPGVPSSSMLASASSEAPLLSTQKAASLTQQTLQQGTPQKGLIAPLNKGRLIQTKTPDFMKPLTGPNHLIQKAAFAAGGRIATPSTAASLLKAVQSKNAVHIRHGGRLPLSSASVTKPPTSANPVPRSNIGQSRVIPPVNPGPASGSSTLGGQQVTSSSGKSANQVLALNGSGSFQPSLQLQVESNILVSASGQSHGDTDAKSAPAVPDNDIPKLPTKEVGVAEPMECEMLVNQEQVPTKKWDAAEDMDIADEHANNNRAVSKELLQSKNESIADKDQETSVNLDLSNKSISSVGHANNDNQVPIDRGLQLTLDGAEDQKTQILTKSDRCETMDSVTGGTSDNLASNCGEGSLSKSETNGSNILKK